MCIAIHLPFRLHLSPLNLKHCQTIFIYHKNINHKRKNGENSENAFLILHIWYTGTKDICGKNNCRTKCVVSV